MGKQGAMCAELLPFIAAAGRGPRRAAATTAFASRSRDAAHSALSASLPVLPWLRRINCRRPAQPTPSGSWVERKRNADGTRRACPQRVYATLQRQRSCSRSAHPPQPSLEADHNRAVRQLPVAAGLWQSRETSTPHHDGTRPGPPPVVAGGIACRHRRYGGGSKRCEQRLTAASRWPAVTDPGARTRGGCRSSFSCF